MDRAGDPAVWLDFRDPRCRVRRSPSVPEIKAGEAVAAKTRLVNQNWWFTTLMVNAHKYCPPLTKDIKCDVLIVGGGFSGISAAAEFLRKGLSVVLIEKNIIGGSSSGRSAGMSDSRQRTRTASTRAPLRRQGCRRNLGCAVPRHRAHRRHHQAARHRMRIAASRIPCSSGSEKAAVMRWKKNVNAARASDSPTSASTTRSQLKGILGAQEYTAGIRYGGTYGINPLACLQGLEGPADRERHAGLRKHRDGKARGSHGLYARRQRDGGPHHRRRRQDEPVDQPAGRREPFTRRHS